MDANAAMAMIGLGGLLGVAGQGARVVVGITKRMGENRRAAGKSAGGKTWFDGKRMAISLCIGAVAGILGTVTLWNPDIDREFLFSIVTIGYSGTDFIEGFMRKAG